jgi:hypothetical protein
LYQAWCDLDLELLPRRAAEVRAILNRADHYVTTRVRHVLEEQLGFLDRLSSAVNGADLVLCFAVLGQFYLDLGRKDFAAMLFHRALEGALVNRVAHRVPGFDSARPDYTLFPGGESAVYEGYLAALKRNGFPAERALPSSVGVLDAVLLLGALDDGMLGQARLDEPGEVRELRDADDIRDGSVLARGSRSISLDGLIRLVKVAGPVVDAYLQKHGGDDQALRKRYENLAFIKAPF